PEATLLLLTACTGVVGAWLARREGLKAMTRIQTDLAHGVPPAAAVLDGALILVAGLVLITPGVLTDLLGFTLLIPPWLRRRLHAYFTKRITIVPPGGTGPFGADDGGFTGRDGEAQRDSFIDVEVIGRNDDDSTGRKP
ncbi:MAG: FxsA family protein, partial [Phycisphaerae bacterium]